VVLSACDTGVVDPESSDSVSALGKAFMEAGAKRVVMTLWKISDAKTVDFMKKFYSEVLKGKDYSQALRSAKVSMIKEGSLPYHWAGFILMGEE
jgi:CHAT domain-containing protein